MLEHAARREPVGIGIVWHLRGRMVRPYPEGRLFAVAHGLVEVCSGGLLHIRVVPSGVAIRCFLAVHHGPEHPACAHQVGVARQILPVPEPERAVLLEHRLVPVVFGPGKQMAHAHALGHLHHLPRVFAGLARRVDHLLPVLRPPLRVAVDPFTLHPGGGRQNQVGDGGRGRRIDVADHDETAVSGSAIEAGEVRQRDPGVGRLDPQRLEIAPLQGAEHVHRVISGRGGNGTGRHFPRALDQGAMLGVGHHHVGWKPVVGRAHFARGAARARLPREAQRIRSWPADLPRDQVQVGDEIVHPGAAHVLVHAHAPQAHGAP